MYKSEAAFSRALCSKLTKKNKWYQRIGSGLDYINSSHITGGK